MSAPAEPLINVSRLIKTKIVCTVGPASSSVQVLEEMIKMGMDMVRMNFSHGDYAMHRRTFNIVRELSAKYDHQISIMCDVQGPKIRTGKMQQPFDLHVGDVTKVTPQDIVGTKDRFQIKYPTLLQDLAVGDLIFINDGIIRLIVKEKTDKDLVCAVEAGGSVSDHKGCNIPSGNLSVSVVTEKDADDLAFIAQLDPEFVAVSFVGTAEDVHQVRRVLKANGNTNIKIIAKIERPVALKNIDSIIAAADGIMVARGDLGVEIPTWEVPIAQKTIVKKCNAEGRTVIVATQALESMTTSARPTRAEASDVFNSVLDGADAVMLSAETATGNHPALVVKTMDNIIEAAERFLPPRNPDDYDSKTQAMTETIGHSTYTIVQQFKKLGYSGKIIVNADSTYVTRMVSKYRSNIDILAFSSDLRVIRELNIVWGVRAIYSTEVKGKYLEEIAEKAIKKAFALKLLKQSDHVIFVSRSQMGKHFGTCNVIYNVQRVIGDHTQPESIPDRLVNIVMSQGFDRTKAVQALQKVEDAQSAVNLLRASQE